MAPEPGWRRRLRDTVEMCEKVQGLGKGGVGYNIVVEAEAGFWIWFCSEVL